ncbi:alpha/beta fold hydrolase [Streptomyces sp. NPDC102451]|uniref:alpha/beta fold hydrolase n=1 Tax=Streptomyces sp. NPDC102451 TaxID=3366177 RepID=UPI003827ECF5
MTTVPRARLRRPASGGDPRRVLLLHGLGGTAAVWERMAPLADERLELWDAELPWRGMAGTDQSLLTDPGQVLAGLADASYDGVVAHSFAAGILLEEYASGRIPPRPTVLLSPFHKSTPGEFDWSSITYYLNGFHQVFEEALEVGDTGRYAARHRTWLARQLRDLVGPYGWMRFFECYLRSPFVDLDAVRAPVLVVSGEKDTAAFPRDGRALAAGLPDARFELLAGCGHFPMQEQSAQVARLLSDFLLPASEGHRASRTSTVHTSLEMS